MHSSPCCSRHSRGRLSEKTKDSCGTVATVPQEMIGWNGLEGKDGPELLAPIMSLVGEHASEFQGVRLVGVRHDVAGFIDERDPGIHFVGQGNSVKVRATEVIAVPGVHRVGAIGAVLHVEYPSRILTLGTGVEDAGKREA